jgi:O-antigen/teichoic acid export membrane protein
MTADLDSMALPDDAPMAGMSVLLRDSSLYLAGNVAFKIVGFLMIPFYARFLSAEEYGVLNLLELATTIVAMAFGLQSVGQSLTRIYHDQTTDEGRNRAVSTAVIGTACVAAVVALLACVFAGPLGDAVSLPGQSGLLRLAFMAMFSASLAELILVYQRMRNRARFFLAYSMGSLVLTLSLNIALIGGLHLGVRGFVLSKLVVTGGGCVFLLARVLREVGTHWHPALARALARFAGPLVVSGGATLAIHFSDRLFLAHVSRAEVGVYSLAYNFAFLLSVLIGDSFSKSWNVSFYGLASGPGWQTCFAGVGRWLMFVLGASALAISLFGRDMLTLMVPPSYYPPLFLLPVLVFGYFLREVGDFFNSMLLIGIGSGLVGRIAIGGAALNLALNAVLIPVYGIWGAAWATFGTWGVYCGVCWVLAWRVHRVVMAPWPLVLVLALSGAGLLVQWLLSPANAVVRLALDTGVLGAFLVVSAAVYFDASERAEAARFARQLLAGANGFAVRLRRRSA